MAKRKSSKSTTPNDPTTLDKAAEEIAGSDSSETLDAAGLEQVDSDPEPGPDTAETTDVSPEETAEGSEHKAASRFDPQGELSISDDAETADYPVAEVDIDIVDEADAVVISEPTEEAPDLISVNTEDVGTPSAEQEETPSEPEVSAVTAAPTAQKSGRFFPLFLGGVIAAALGFIAARGEILDPLLPEGLRAKAPVVETAPVYDDTALKSGLEALSARLDDLETTIAAFPDPADTAPPQDAPEVDLSGIEAEIAAITSKVEALETQPVIEAPVPTEALDAALAELRATASAQQAEIDRLLSDQKEVIANAETAAQATLARTAMTSIQSAIDTGAPFDVALAELANTGLADVPPALSGVAEGGVPSLAMLQNSIPDAARAALAAARDSETGTGLGGFIQRQLGARAVEPRQGSDPDAVLSRIEAATKEGDLDKALSETDALPAPALDAMGAWIEQARARQNAVSAANTLAESLTAL